MSAVTTPIHTGGVGIANLRLFAPADGARQFPWSSLDDLYACLSVPEAMKQAFRQNLQSDFKDGIRIVVTSDGITSLVSHSVAQGIIEANRQLGRCSDETRSQYDRAATAALSILTAGVSSEAFLAYISEAVLAERGAPT